MEHYTYLHKTSSGRVFYVGKGKERRAWAKNKRSAYWQRVAKKHGLQVEVVAHWPTEAEAVANSRAARSEWLERGIHEYWTPERREAARQAVAGENHPNFGKKFSDELREKLSASHRGQFNVGKSRAVRCVDTGEIFPSAAEAAASMGKARSCSPMISAAARGKFASAYGRRWEFA